MLERLLCYGVGKFNYINGNIINNYLMDEYQLLGISNIKLPCNGSDASRQMFRRKTNRANFNLVMSSSKYGDEHSLITDIMKRNM